MKYAFIATNMGPSEASNSRPIRGEEETVGESDAKVAKGRNETLEPSRLAFAEYCAACHDDGLQGGEPEPLLVGADLQYGDSTAELIRAIGGGYPERGMPSLGKDLTPELVKGLSLFVSEPRQGFDTTSQSWESPIPESTQHARDDSRLGYSGSSGTHVPAAELHRLERLKANAEASPAVVRDSVDRNLQSGRGASRR